MEIRRLAAPEAASCDRIYVMAATLKAFKGRRHVEVHIFRHGATQAELDALRHKGLVGPADPSMPPQLLAGATEERALACLLEAFTAGESEALAAWLETRYADQMERLTICPLELPVPLGVGPLGEIPEGGSTGFIRFDQARGYALPFAARGFYDLSAQTAHSPDAPAACAAPSGCASASGCTSATGCASATGCGR